MKLSIDPPEPPRNVVLYPGKITGWKIFATIGLFVFIGLTAYKLFCNRMDARFYDNYPIPVLMPPNSIWTYHHWACPGGYEPKEDEWNRRVWCRPTDEAARQGEEYERRFTPEGHP